MKSEIKIPIKMKPNSPQIIYEEKKQTHFVMVYSLFLPSLTDLDAPEMNKGKKYSSND